jgi:hypothetical protein
MKPTSAQIAANTLTDWSIGIAASSNRVEVRRLDVQMPGGDPAQAAQHFSVPPGAHLHEHAREPTLHPGEVLRVAQRCNRGRAVDQRPDLRRFQHGAQQCRHETRADLRFDDLQLFRSDRGRHRRGQHDRPLARELARREVAQQRTA